MNLLLLRSTLLALVLALTTAVPFVDRGSSGQSDATITFGSRRRGDSGGGTSVQLGETSATSVQTSTGDGQQTNQGEARAVSVQQQTGLGGSTQVTNNQGVIQALQQAGGNSTGSSTSQQTSNNQVNINSSQLQQNVEGTLVNVQGGSRGVVIVNTNERAQRRLVVPPANDPSEDQPQQSDDGNTLLNIVDDGEIVFVITANKTEEEPPIPASSCRYVCIRPTNNTPYCCDDGTNRRGAPAIHGGQCPPLRFLCTRFVFFRKCAHDGQCAGSDKCCYDDCAQHHICKMADPVHLQ